VALFFLTWCNCFHEGLDNNKTTSGQSNLT